MRSNAEQFLHAQAEERSRSAGFKPAHTPSNFGDIMWFFGSSKKEKEQPPSPPPQPTPEERREDIQRTIIDELISSLQSVQPANRARCERSVRAIYRLAKLPECEHIMWFDSPLSALLAIVSLRTMQPKPIRNDHPSTIAISNRIEEFIREASSDPRFSSLLDGLQTDLHAHFEQICRENIEAVFNEDAKAAFSGAISQQIVNQACEVSSAGVKAGFKQNLLPSVVANLLRKFADDVGARSFKSAMFQVIENTTKITNEQWNRIDGIDAMQIGRFNTALGRIHGPILAQAFPALRQSFAKPFDSHIEAFRFDATQLLRSLSIASVQIELDKAADRPWPKEFADINDLLSDVGMLFLFKRLAVVVAKPSMMLLDLQGRPHAEEGAAIEFADGWKIHAWHGVPVEERIITNPESITIPEIRDAGNMETRRVLIDRYGQARYMLELGAKVVQKDAYGELLRLEGRPEPMVMVKVINKTREPDGTFREYFLRVPPDIRTAKDGVAWTFDIPADQYKPKKET